MQTFGAGFALGLSLIMAIGAQNAFVLRQGIRRSHVFAVCLTCAFSDAILIGAVFLLAYGARAFHSAWRGGAVLAVAGQGGEALGPVLATCLALTWLNPHVYLDTVVLLGAVAAQYEDRLGFAMGAMSASFVFFFSLGYGARRLAPLFARPQAWRVLDVCVGLLMWIIAFSLIRGAIGV